MFNLDAVLDKISNWFLKQTVSANGYHVAGIHLATVGVACLIFHTSIIFDRFTQVLPFLSGYFWSITFCSAAVCTSRIRKSKTEFPYVTFTYVFPLSFFYTMLFVTNVLNNGSVMLTSVLIALGLLMPIFAVYRSVALAYYRAYAAALEVQLREQIKLNAKVEDESRRRTEAIDLHPRIIS